MLDFGPRLRALREEKNLGIKRLARDLNVSYTYISHIERGKAKPSLELIKKIAAYFGVEEEDLLLSVGRYPADIEKILYEHPKEEACFSENLLWFTNEPTTL